jgi:ABC-type nitrate/sulfonate/bicarbonate transport system permease component
MLIGLGAFWVIVTYTIAGVKFVDPVLIRAAQSMDTPHGIIFAQVVLPAALPRIFTGLKVALAVCFMIIVAAEMIGTVTGLGSLIYDARNSFRTDITMDGMLIIGLLGFGASKLLDLLERLLLPWQGGTEQ